MSHEWRLGPVKIHKRHLVGSVPVAAGGREGKPMLLEDDDRIPSLRTGDGQDWLSTSKKARGQVTFTCQKGSRESLKLST